MLRSRMVYWPSLVKLVALLVSACGGGASNENLVLTLIPQDPERTGFITVTGVVSTSMPVPKGALVVFGITAGRPLTAGVFDESVSQRAPAQTDTISLRIEKLRSAEAYSFYVGVDLNGDNVIGVGDLGGYFDGSTVLPFAAPASARLIPVKRNFSELDFGIGIIK